MKNNDDPIVIVAAARTPTGSFNGQFKDIPATELGSAAIKAILNKSNLKADEINEVYMGCVLPAGLGQAPARQASLLAGLSEHIPCTTINKVCGSGMKTVMIAYDTILLDAKKILIAGGMENMTRAPYLLTKGRFGYRLGKNDIYDHMMLDGLEDAYQKEKSMGFFAEQCAAKFHFTREEQDHYAMTSLKRAQEAVKTGVFREEIAKVPVKLPNGETSFIEEDEGIQKLDVTKIPKLKPAFMKDGTVTAANSSSISDGAAALILMRLSEAQRRGLKPLAKIVGHFSYAQKPEWFTTAPIAAIKGLLQKINWRQDEVDLFEINEAFAVVVMAAMKELNLSIDKINIHGGACVLGHPIGASGSRIIVTLLYALKQKKLKRGMASLCIGGGEATAVAVEMINP